MARAQFYDVGIDSSGNAVTSTQVSVYARGTTTLSTIYSNETGSTPKSNPFNASTGAIDFWASPGEYDIAISDTNAPPAFASRTIGWSSIPGVDGVVEQTIAADAVTSAKIPASAVGTSEIADDAVTNAKIGPDAVTITEIASNAVGTSELVDDSVTNTKLDDTTVLNIAGISSSTVRRGKAIISTTETTTSASYTTLTTPDQVSSLVLPTDGLIFLVYQAQWQCSASAAASAAVFLGSNQQQVANLSTFNGVATSATCARSAGTSRYQSLISTPQSLISVMNTSSAVGADVTTGQALGVTFFNTPSSTVSIGIETGSGGAVALTASGTTMPVMAGGIMTIFAAAGTYDVAIKFKTTSGTVSVKNRSLWVWTQGF